MTPHDLTQHSPNHYTCSLCGQAWSRKPSLKCPGLKVYPKDNYSPLMTKGQLGYYGYQMSNKSLPPPAGCYLLEELGSYVMLYDPGRAVKRYETPGPRTRILLTEIHWPVKWLPLLESFSEYAENNQRWGPVYAERMNNMANMIGITLTFTPDELEQFAGALVKLILSKEHFARRSYPSSNINWEEQRKLVSDVIAAYMRQKEAFHAHA